ncbi:hypothetical protein HXX76_014273 [Chlamydomonas incerta]|uniref:Protein kinase domain-containing protein n=1 Tax=Chlamydomonas incerta TaxID=51695 RepID=A0A835SH16_CHLIN|nr:hypothetical protein HXX76_014273 [Chlamydomonas incerta]|eukprot:KAG2424697.1 hypothetical protein HXX76_014273 [Chlamydomonas incerta]
MKLLGQGLVLRVPDGITAVPEVPLQVAAATTVVITGSGSANSALDLRAFAVPAFQLPRSARLEFHNLSLLLPPLPAEGSYASAAGLGGGGGDSRSSSSYGVIPVSVLSHVVLVRLMTAAAAPDDTGSDGSTPGRVRVLLQGVTLVTGACSDLAIYRSSLCSSPDAWRQWAARGVEPTVLQGVVRHGGGGSGGTGHGALMALSLGDDTNATATSMSNSSSSGALEAGARLPPLAQLLNCTVTCDTGVSDGGSARLVPSGPSAGPWDCIAVTVSDGAGLAALPDLWAKAPIGAKMFVTVEAGGIAVDAAGWQTLEVEPTRSVLLLGRGRDVSQLHLGGMPQRQFVAVGSTQNSQGLVAVYDMTLAGLSYPARAVSYPDLFAAWVHAIGIYGTMDPYRPLVGRATEVEAMVLLGGVRLLVPEAEARWWRNAASAAAAGGDVASGGIIRDMVGGRWQPALSVSVVTTMAAATTAAMNISAPAESQLPLPPPAGEAPETWGASQQQVGPLAWGRLGVWSFRGCWVATESAAVAAVAAGPTVDGEGPTAAAVAAASSRTSTTTWPLAESLGSDVASQLSLDRLGLVLNPGAMSPDDSYTPSIYSAVMAGCSAAAAGAVAAGGGGSSPVGRPSPSPGDDVVLLPPADPEALLQSSGGNALLNGRLRRDTGLGVNLLPLGSDFTLADGMTFEQMVTPEVWLGGQQGGGSGLRCVLLPPPAAQSAPGPATWDMMDLSDRIRIRLGPAGSNSDGPSLQVQGFTLYNLSPYAQQPQQPAEPPAEPQQPPQPLLLVPPQQPPARPPSPPPPPLPPPPPPPPPDPSDPFHGLALALPFFKFDRFSPLLYAEPPLPPNQQQSSPPSAPPQQRRRPPLALVNCSLVVPPPELELLRRLLQEAGRLLPAEPAATTSRAAVAAGSRRRGRRALADERNAATGSNADDDWPWARPAWPAGVPPASGPEVPLPAQLLACPRWLLLSYAAVAEVAAASATAISFRRISFLGWSGRDVIITSQLPEDAPTGLIRLAADLDRPLFSALLDLHCSPPPPEPPSPAPPPPAPPSASGAGVGVSADAAPGPSTLPAVDRAELRPPADAPVAGGPGGTSSAAAAAAAGPAADVTTHGSGGAAMAPFTLEAVVAVASGTAAVGAPSSSTGQQHAWVVPAAATLAAVGGVLLLLVVVSVAVVLARCRRDWAQQRQLHHDALLQKEVPAGCSSSGGRNGSSTTTAGRRSDATSHDGDSATATASLHQQQPQWHSLDASRLLRTAETVIARSREVGNSGGGALDPSSSEVPGRQLLILSPACRVVDPHMLDSPAAASTSHTPTAAAAAVAALRDGGGIARAVRKVTAAMTAAVERDEELRLECVIGRGAFGVVCLGSWRGLPVAVKTLVVHAALLGEEGCRRQRAVLEAAISSTLCHPNLVQTYAFDVRRLGELGGLPAGGSIKGRRQQGGSGSGGAGPAALEEEDGHGGAGRGQRQLGGAADQQGPEAAEDAVYQLLLIQAYCEGGSLREGIESSQLYMGLAPDSPPGVALGLCLALDVAAGMVHVHARGIVHGDLCSANVLLAARPPTADEPQTQAAGSSPEEGSSSREHGSGGAISARAEQSQASQASVEAMRGKSPATGGEEEAHAAAAEAAARWTTRHFQHPPVVARIADFGLSKRMGEGQTHASHCWQGTPYYTAPEVETEGRLSKAADVYGFGVVLVELLTGRSAPVLMSLAGYAGGPRGRGDTAAALLSALSHQAALAPGRPGSDQLAALVTSCLSPSPQRPTFAQVLQSLATILVRVGAGGSAVAPNVL